VALWWQIPLAVVGGLGLLWLALLAVLWGTRPESARLADGLRLLPDVIMMLRRLAADAELPRGIRIRLGLLMAYLLLPIDLIPDFIPVLGYADDVIIVAFILRSVAHRAGTDALRQHWPGTPEGLQVVLRLVGLSTTRRHETAFPPRHRRWSRLPRRHRQVGLGDQCPQHRHPGHWHGRGHPRSS
jgi:uncharacterized membrane protein YkvA (DUF1232 family)